MISSQKNVVLAIFQDRRTVFRLIDAAMLVGASDFQSINKKLNYAVRTGKLLNPRKGIYAKPGYQKEELACAIFKPAYISLEYVLQKAGVIFQFDSRITLVSYLSRTLRIESQVYAFRKIKNSIIVDTRGIDRQENHVNIALKERAFLDLLYLDKTFYFDNLNPLNKGRVEELLPLYQSKSLEEKVKKILLDG